jgi:hypothetical protein
MEVLGKDNRHHMSEMRRKGWREVPAERHPERMPDGHQGAIIIDGQILMEWPTILVNEMHAIEKREAKGKLRRAKLSHVQLATYYVGLRAWQKVRQQVEAQRGTGFQLRAFHDQALDEGAVPLARLATETKVEPPLFLITLSTRLWPWRYR